MAESDQSSSTSSSTDSDSSDTSSSSGFEDSDGESENYDVKITFPHLCSHCGHKFFNFETLSVHQNDILQKQMKNKPAASTEPPQKKLKHDHHKNNLTLGNDKNTSNTQNDNSKKIQEEVVKKIHLPCQFCKKVFDRYDEYKLHCAEKHAKNYPHILPNRNDELFRNTPDADHVVKDTSKNVTDTSEKETIREENKNYWRISKHKDTENLSNELKILMNYLKRNPSKVKDLLHLLDLDVKQNIRPRLYKCMKCNIHIVRTSEFENHLKTNKHEDKKFKCDHCKLDFTRKSLQRHLKVHEKDDMTAKDFDIVSECENIGSESDSYDTASTISQMTSLSSRDQVAPVKSTMSVGGDRQILVPNDPSKNNLAEKMKKKQILYKCDDCHVTFLNKANLMRHAKEDAHYYANKTCIKCSHCGLKFSNKQTVTHHISYHHNKLKLSLKDFKILVNSKFQ